LVAARLEALELRAAPGPVDAGEAVEVVKAG